jgi:hypothetical protein
MRASSSGFGRAFLAIGNAVRKSHLFQRKVGQCRGAKTFNASLRHNCANDFGAAADVRPKGAHDHINGRPHGLNLVEGKGLSDIAISGLNAAGARLRLPSAGALRSHRRHITLQRCSRSPISKDKAKASPQSQTSARFPAPERQKP